MIKLCLWIGVGPYSFSAAICAALPYPLLDMASLPVNENTVAMTKQLMDAGLPIDKNTLQQIWHESNAFPDAEILDLVNLHRVELPVTEENITQMASYRNLTHQLTAGIAETGEGITKSVQYALERIGKPEPDLEKLKVFIGPPLMEMFMQYAQIDEATAKQAVEIYRERYSVTGIFENAVYPGIENMLAQLEKKGYILAVASSKPEVYVRQILDHFGLTRYFTEIGGSELNGRRTNKTEVIEDVLKRLNMDKHRDQVIMVGDKEHDVYGARKAGLECIAVSFGYGTEEELKQAEPLKIVDSAEGIVDFFA